MTWEPPPIGPMPPEGDPKAPCSPELAAWYHAKWHQEDLEKIANCLARLPPHEREWVYRNALARSFEAVK